MYQILFEVKGKTNHDCIFANPITDHELGVDPYNGSQNIPLPPWRGDATLKLPEHGYCKLNYTFRILSQMFK